ncbi:MAG TPA: hypothetical protein VE753_10750, partial [Gaiellaceae bacterium]|nr:hypothetical protein [Gaiellaceae bacterium]
QCGRAGSFLPRRPGLPRARAPAGERRVWITPDPEAEVEAAYPPPGLGSVRAVDRSPDQLRDGKPSACRLVMEKRVLLVLSVTCVRLPMLQVYTCDTRAGVASSWQIHADYSTSIASPKL